MPQTLYSLSDSSATAMPGCGNLSRQTVLMNWTVSKTSRPTSCAARSAAYLISFLHDSSGILACFCSSSRRNRHFFPALKMVDIPPCTKRCSRQHLSLLQQADNNHRLFVYSYKLSESSGNALRGSSEPLSPLSAANLITFFCRF